jgi:hypothetical protein
MKSLENEACLQTLRWHKHPQIKAVHGKTKTDKW